MDAEIRQIYYCKSFLNVQRISDICTADRVFILPSIAKGDRSIRKCASKLEEIKQERPRGNTWTVWKWFLNTICKNKGGNIANKNTNIIIDDNEEEYNNKFSIGTLITKYWKGIPYTGIVAGNTGKYYKIRYYEDNNEEELNHTVVRKHTNKNRGEGRTTREIGQRMRLRIPLGDWNILANESEQLWQFYYSHNTDTLYRSYREEWHRNGDFYYDWHAMTDNDAYKYVPLGNVKTLSKDASKTDVMDTEVRWRVLEHLPMRKKETKKSYKKNT
jgi:hypothetical protein